jgi:MerR family transcriptional regulator, light-induced transcriptional regulator
MTSPASTPQFKRRKKANNQSAAQVIADNMRDLASATVEREYRAHPELQRYGSRGRARCVEDSEFHLEFLIASLNAESVGQFVDYCGWAKVLLSHRGIDVSHLIDNLKHLRLVLRKKLSERQFALVSKHLRAGMDALPDLPNDLPSRIAPERPYSDLANSYLNALLKFDHQRASEIVLKSSSKGASVKDIYRHIITPAQHEIGRLWQLGKLTVVHEHYCTSATEIVMAELFRHLVPSSPSRERLLMAFCVEGERHCIALKMFSDLMSLEGWQVRYIGQDTPTSSAVRFICQEKPAVVAVSVTFAKSVRSLETLVKEIRANPDCGRAKILIGGSAASMDLCQRVGADGYAECIGDAVEVANRLAA